MNIFKKFNKRVDCTRLVKTNEDGSYDVTNVMVLGQVMGAVSTMLGVGICVIIKSCKK